MVDLGRSSGASPENSAFGVDTSDARGRFPVGGADCLPKTLAPFGPYSPPRVQWPTPARLLLKRCGIPCSGANQLGAPAGEVHDRRRLETAWARVDDEP